MASATPVTMKGALTTLIISPSDLKRARREVESIDDAMHQAGLRASAGGSDTKPLQVSRLIDEIVSETGVNLAKATERAQLLKYLSDMIEHAPVLHFSFASEPSMAFMSKLIVWLRTNIHPQVLVHLGLQPSIAAGCVVRTANKQFDFSLNAAFEAQHDLLVQSLALPAAPPAAAPAKVADIAVAAVPVEAAADPTPKPTAEAAHEAVKPKVAA